MNDIDGMATVTIRDIPKEQHKALRRYCVDEEISLNQLMLRLVREFVEAHEGQAGPEGEKKGARDE